MKPIGRKVEIMGDNLFTHSQMRQKLHLLELPYSPIDINKKHMNVLVELVILLIPIKLEKLLMIRATLDIVYIGKTSKDSIKAKEALEAEFEDVFKDRTKEEKDEIQKRYGTMQAYLENMDRLRKIADDLVNHYVDDILPNGYKAMVVASSVLAAARYQYLLPKL